MNTLQRSEQLGEILGRPVITFTGNTNLRIEGHKGVTEYETAHVTVRLGKYNLRVEGVGLAISSINSDCLTLTGEIQSVRFES
ncbi:MAG: YabP/YqfC family sporulation protein [Oscillospiraceae bacterium]|jgi:sporulation protein YqfC|nr:YabP/YqfC family sporulation protein [Oscillospiraceae bacterium]